MTREVHVIDRGEHFEFHQKGFPSIVLDYVDDYPEELFRYFKGFLKTFNYNQLQPYDWHVKSFQTQKQYGAKAAANEIEKAFEEAARTNPELRAYASQVGRSFPINDWVNSISVAIYQCMPPQIKNKYFPMADFYIMPHGAYRQDLKLCLSCLVDVPLVGYVSPIEPKVEINGRQYIVAYPVHIIEQMGANLPYHERSKPRPKKIKRFIPDPDDHLGLGDFYGFLYGCINFEQTGDICATETQEYGPALTCYETCVSPGWFQWHYVEDLLDYWHPEQKYYYRVGYCPVVLKEPYAILKTLLLPGFFNTPEYRALHESDLSPSEKCKLKSLFIMGNRFQWLQEHGTFAFLKQMHEWIPQVITTDREMFRYPHRQE